MGNAGSHSRRSHHHHHHHRTEPAPQSQPHMTTNQYVFAAPSHYPNANPSQGHRHHAHGYLPPLPLPFPQSYHRYPAGTGGASPSALTPFVEHQKAVTIRNNVNIRKETIRVEEDDQSPGNFLVAFTFDAVSPGSITVVYFAKEGGGCNLIATKESILKPVTVSFEPGLGQKFRQPSGTGIGFTAFEEAMLTKEHDDGVYPLVVKAEAFHPNIDESETSPTVPNGNSQMTFAVFDRKEKDEYVVHVMKQILWANNMRYELQEIYGIGNSVDAESDGNDPAKECVICMSEPRDTTVLPCRHMCMCSGCAKVLQFRTNRCPICRQPVERLLEIKVNDGTGK
ncbi:hypothetical protein K2173_016749 [Erythroxylum novogranatense]|uniref:RING-type E3 ubiquitin transferase n=1 Tax=Erythroxylum novogranatense TaxID=1862640 RepID=A0AAV8SHN8_9ROSI|nr:hypothetical protein K2173_016749 [Erythroxylum novogranatense]